MKILQFVEDPALRGRIEQVGSKISAVVEWPAGTDADVVIIEQPQDKMFLCETFSQARDRGWRGDIWMISDGPLLPLAAVAWMALAAVFLRKEIATSAALSALLTHKLATLTAVPA